jgi:hypothetical protein
MLTLAREPALRPSLDVLRDLLGEAASTWVEPRWPPAAASPTTGSSAQTVKVAVWTGDRDVEADMATVAIPSQHSGLRPTSLAADDEPDAAGAKSGR